MLADPCHAQEHAGGDAREWWAPTEQEAAVFDAAVPSVFAEANPAVHADWKQLLRMAAWTNEHTTVRSCCNCCQCVPRSPLLQASRALLCLHGRLSIFSISANTVHAVIRFVPTTHVLRLSLQGLNHLLSVTADDLDTSDEAMQGLSGEARARRLALRAAFWREWSVGKPVIVGGIRGKMCWGPQVRRPVPTQHSPDL
jgi:hypothetical protein